MESWQDHREYIAAKLGMYQSQLRLLEIRVIGRHLPGQDTVWPDVVWVAEGIQRMTKHFGDSQIPPSETKGE